MVNTKKERHIREVRETLIENHQKSKSDEEEDDARTKLKTSHQPNNKLLSCNYFLYLMCSVLTHVYNSRPAMFSFLFRSLGYWPNKSPEINSNAIVENCPSIN